MFEELKKKILKGSLLWSVILIIAGLGLAGWFSIDAFYSVTGFADFTKLEPAQIKNQLVETDLDINFGCFLERYSKNTKTNVRTTTHLYYVIWTGDDNATDYRYMAVRVPAGYEKRMDALAEGTATAPVRICGKIKKLSGEEYSYFKSYLHQAGFTDDDILTQTLPYYIDCFSSGPLMRGLYISAFAAGVALLIFGIFRIAKTVGGNSLKKLRQDIAAAGYSEAAVEADYRAAESYDKKGNFRIGLLMTYYISGSDARAIPNTKMMWAYQNTITHRTNGVKTGTTYNVMIYDEISPKGHTFSVANESIAQDVLTRISTTLPWVVVGYSDEIRKLYNKDRMQFLQLRYNTCEHVAVEPGSGNQSSDGPA